MKTKTSKVSLALVPGVLLAGVSAGIAFPIFPQVGLKAGLSLAFIGAILAANRFARLVSAPLLGLLADRVSLKRFIVVGLGAQCLSLGCYVLAVDGHTGVWLLIGRLVNGPAAAAVIIGAQAMTLARPGNSAVFGVRASMSAGLPLGVALGGWLSTHLGDARTFASALAAMLFATVLAWWWLPSGELRAPVARAARGFEPRIWALGTLNFAVTFSALGVVLTTVTLVVATQHLHLGGLDSKTSASALLGSMVVLMGASTLAVGRLFQTVASRLTASIVGVVLLAASLALLARSTGMPGLALGVCLVGLCAGALSALVLALLGDLVATGDTGKGVGLIQLCGDVGGVLGPMVASWLLSHGAVAPFALSSVVVALGAPVGVWLRRSVLRQAPAPSWNAPATRAGRLGAHG